MAWQGSTRRRRLPPDWPKRRAQVKARANGQCEAPQHAPGCTGVGTECDHIKPGDNHELSNLQWLSAACHKAKTNADNAMARAALQAMRKRPPEAHPGAIN